MATKSEILDLIKSEVIGWIDEVLGASPAVSSQLIATSPAALRMVRLRRAANQAVANNTLTALTWDTLQEDTLGAWAAGTPDRLTLTAGLYLLSIGCGTGSVGPTAYFTQLEIETTDGGTTTTEYIDKREYPGGRSFDLALSVCFRITSSTNSRVRAILFQGSGASVNLGSPRANHLRLVKLG